MHAYAGCMHAAHTPLHMSYTHCMLVTFTLHTPNMPYTCHKAVLCMLHMHCILATCLPRLNYFQMHTFMLAQAYYMQERHKLAAIHCKHIQCMHAPGKKHSSCTHATLTCIIDATYATCASMWQACQRHKLCACWNVCMYATLILNILQAH
jgi:hypothetical protein